MSSDSQLQQQHKNDQSTQQKPLDENSIIARYRALSTECTNLTQKIAELDQDRNEHSLVAETLKPLDSSRRAFRLIGGVLVERTVGEVLPSVVNNKESLDKVITNLEKRLVTRRRDLAEWKEKYDIKTADEAEALRKAQEGRGATPGVAAS